MAGAVHSSEFVSLEAQLVGTAVGRNPLHLGVPDAEFLLEQGDVMIQAVNLGWSRT